MESLERRHMYRRSTDGCSLNREQVGELLKKVEKNHDTSIRYEAVLDRLDKVELRVGMLCNRITNALWAICIALGTATVSLIAGLWHIVKWIQELIEHSIIIS